MGIRITDLLAGVVGNVLSASKTWVIDARTSIATRNTGLAQVKVVY